MAILTREVKIEWKINPNFFQVLNQKVLTMPVQRIGSTRAAVNRMLTKDEMMRTLMPAILGIDPTSQSSNWTKELNDYWHSLCKEVPEGGLTLDTSLSFDIDDGHPIRSKYIKSLCERNKDIKTSEDLKKALTDSDSKYKVTEDEMYRYAAPVSVEDYLLWYYAKGYRGIANSLGTINKSSKIDFYMYDTETKKEIKRKKSASAISAVKEYVKISSDVEVMRSALIVMAPDRGREIIKMSDEDVSIELHTILTAKPDLFIKVVSDKNLKLRGNIEKYIASSVLKRIPDTKTIVDGVDQTKILGHSPDEVIVYLTTDNPENKKYLSELGIRYKSTIQ